MPAALSPAQRQNALVAAFVADALGMPVHWFYNPVEDIPKHFPNGGITGDKFEAPNLTLTHPLHVAYKGWMTQPADGPKPEHNGKLIVGDVILRGTGKENWGPQQSHPHKSLPAGGTTLNASCTRLMMRHLTSDQPFPGESTSSGRQGQGKGTYNKKNWLTQYIAFLTDEKQSGYKDTYAEGYHRNFFDKLTAGKSPEECADAEEGSASIGGLATQPPLIICALAEKSGLSPQDSLAHAKKVAREHLFTSAPHERLGVVLDSFVELVQTLAFSPRPLENPEEDKKFCMAALSQALACQDHDLPAILSQSEKKKDTDVIGFSDGAKFPSSCDIKNSWGSTIYLVSKYAFQEDGVKKAIVANINTGGENVHRGFIVAFLAALVNPKATKPIDDLAKQLDEAEGILQETAAVVGVATVV